MTYAATLCNCAAKPAKAREAERLYCQALNNHFGSPAATLAAFEAAGNGGMDEAAWARADYAAAESAFVGWPRMPMGAHFDLDTE
jgi:hypothetical protein